LCKDLKRENELPLSETSNIAYQLNYALAMSNFFPLRFWHGANLTITPIQLRAFQSLSKMSPFLMTEAGHPFWWQLHFCEKN
jgi:hypothetical protein